MTIEEKRSYEKLITGGKESDEKYEQLRKLSIVMMGEGVIIQREDVCRLLVDDYADVATGMEEFFERTKSHNGFITGQHRDPFFVWGARIYLIVTFLFSVYAAAGNLAGRDNFFERLTDGLTCITVLWFTLFGLIKLQSDDQNIIRNLVLGRVPIEHEDELIEYLGTDVESIKVALCRTPQDYGWLSEKDCCYVKGHAEGKIEILGGLQATPCDLAGLLEVDEGVVFDLVNNTLGQGVKERGRMHVTNWSRSTIKWLYANRVPANCVVAGLCDHGFLSRDNSEKIGFMVFLGFVVFWCTGGDFGIFFSVLTAAPFAAVVHGSFRTPIPDALPTV